MHQWHSVPHAACSDTKIQVGCLGCVWQWIVWAVCGMECLHVMVVVRRVLWLHMSRLARGLLQAGRRVSMSPAAAQTSLHLGQLAVMRYASRLVEQPDAEPERLPVVAGLPVRRAVRCHCSRGGLSAIYWLGCTALILPRHMFLCGSRCMECTWADTVFLAMRSSSPATGETQRWGRVPCLYVPPISTLGLAQFCRQRCC